MQQLTEGTMRRNKRTGEVQVLQNGQWVSQGGAAPSPQPGPMVVGTPRPEKPQVRQVGNQLGLADPNTGAFTPTYTAPEKPEKPNLPAGYRLRPDGTAERIPGLPPAGGGEDDVKIQQKRAALSSLEQQINRVEELYRKGFRDEANGILSSLAEYLPSDEASQLNAAAAGMAEQGLAAFRVPGAGSQSDAELRQFVEANKPSSWDRDAAVEEKLRQLRIRVDATRAEMGMPPAQWLPDDAPVVHDANIGGEQLVRSTGGTKTIDNPALKGVRGEYLRRLGAGQPASEIIGFLRQAGISDPKVLRSAMEQIKFRQQNPNVPVEKYNTDALDDMDVPLSGVEGAMNDIGQSGAGAYLMRAGNAVTANNLDSIVGATGGNAERARISLADAGRANPGAALAGDLSGGVLAALTGEAGLARFGMTPGLGRAIAADAGYGAAAGAGAADGGDRLAGAGIGLAAGAAGSLAGNALTRGVGNALTGVTDRSVNALLQQKTPLTIGQTVGRSGRVGQIVKGVEDRVAGLPIVGDMVNARRTEGVRVMNSRAFDKALEPLGETVGNKVGEEAVEEAHGLVQQAFRDALAGKSAQLDVNFVRDAAAPLNRIRQIRRDGIGDEVVEQIEEATRGYFDPATGEITGENMQALLASLRQIRQSYRNDPLGHRIGGEVRKIETAVERIFERQTPDVMPRYRAAKQAFRRVSTLADAVNRGKNTEGVFTPGQLGMADRANSVKFDGSMAAASGKGQFHDFQRAAQDVLPNKVPDSGTAGRLATAIVPGAIAGSGAGIGYAAGDTQAGAQAGLGLATIVSALYTKQGQRALVALAAKRGPKTRAAGQKVKQKARIAGAAGGQAALGYTRD